MNNTALRCWTWPLTARVPAHWPSLLLVASLLLYTQSGLQAQPTVTTIGGGSASKPYWGYINGNTLTQAKFDLPAGLAMDPSGTILFVADYSNNVVRMVSHAGNTASSVTTTFASASLSRPLAVAVDGSTNVFVLNHGANGSGSLVRITGVGGTSGTVTTVATGLANATAFTLDHADNCYATVNGNAVVRIATNGTVTTVGTIGTSGTSLQGIALLANGLLALSDAGNDGILTMNPSNGATADLTGFHGAGDQVGASTLAAFRTPETISAAGNNTLVVADHGNDKVKVVDAAGNVSLLYGVSSNLWVTGSGTFPGWADGLGATTNGSAESRQPYGVVVAPDTTVYVSEDYYHVLRHVTDTGLTAPAPTGSGSGGSGGGGTVLAGSFNGPEGIAYDSIGNWLMVANAGNDTVQLLDPTATTNSTSDYLGSANGLATPVAVLVDKNENVYVLDQGTSGNGFISEFDIYGNSYGQIVTGLDQPTAFTMDGFGNLLVAEKAGSIRAFGTVTAETVAVITNANASLAGIALFDDGTIAVSDATNQVIWIVNTLTKAVTKLTGRLGVRGAAVGTTNFAEFNQPHQLVRAGSDELIAADSGNNRLVVIQRSGATTTNQFKLFNSVVWFGGSGGPIATNDTQFVTMVSPLGVAVGENGEIFASETHYSDVRGLAGTTIVAPTSDPGVSLPTYSSPAGIALNNEGTMLYVASTTNNTITTLNLLNNETEAILGASNGISHPVDLALDGSDNLYVLNQASGGQGYILEFDPYGNLLATNAIGLLLPTAMTQDSSGDILVAEQGGAVREIYSGSTASDTVATLAVLTNVASCQIEGIALFDDGTIALSDAANQVIWQMNPVSKAATVLTGQLHSPGTTFGSASFAKLSQPQQLKLASGNQLVVADSGNNRLVVVSRSGAITNALLSTNAIIWFGSAGDPVASSSAEFVPMVSPVGAAIGNGGSVFASETYYNDIREITGTSLSAGGNGGITTSSNIVVPLPTIIPNYGYYPMGQKISVQSTAQQIFYTTDGSTPTANSPEIKITNDVAYIPWFNSTNDLTSLRVTAALYATNFSAVVAGQLAPYATIGVPPISNAIPNDLSPALHAGVGSTVVIPIVCNLTTNQQIQSYQFRFEISPLNSTNTPAISPLSIIPTNDFVPLVTAAQSGHVASNTISSYSLGTTNGLVIFAVGAGTHILFQNYAVVAMLEAQIPNNANQGDTYALNVLYPSATSDSYNTPVALTAMPQMTIVVTNIPYTVGDSASSVGAWYNAGTFGNGNLDNADVNQAFYAASGLRVPYSFSDVYNAMDAYPPDSAGFVGGDGQIRFLDWVTILNRSLRLDPYNWAREWSLGGTLVDFATNLVTPQIIKAAKDSPKDNSAAPWYRQALLGADSVGYMSPGSTAEVPVYLKLTDGANLSGLQFRAVVTAQGPAPALSNAPQLVTASGVANPMLTQSFKAAETAFGWSLDAFDCSSRSSNFLGWVTFALPTNAITGESYQVSFLNADGAPDATNQYDFETRSATVTVNAAAPPATICSDEWKIYFFGSTTNPLAADNADPDGDGMPNWVEFLAGTDPTDAASKLQLTETALAVTNQPSPVQLSWLTAPGRAYALQWSTGLASGVWQTLANVSGSGSVTNCADFNPADATRFYRLNVLP